MGRIAELKRITKARIEAFLDAVEKPEHILPQLEKEMAQKVEEAANAEAKAMAATRGAQRRIDEAAGRALRLETGAQNAIRAEDMDTARRAVAALVDAEENNHRLRGALEAAHTAWLNARHVRIQLQENLKDVKTRKREILARCRRIELQKTINPKGTVHVTPGDDILETVARMEINIDRAEAEIEAGNHLHSLDLTLDDRDLDRKLHDAEVDLRLAQLKERYESSHNPDREALA
ncbi:MAG: PspA/IM30 family protein [Phycisphaerae bacterium]|nr:PspA/IM30 family protein [Phycisphaerae bacterium]